LLCKEKKIRCDGALPCTRCWRLALQCVPQIEGGRGVRGYGGGGGGGGGWSGGGGGGSSRSGGASEGAAPPVKASDDGVGAEEDDEAEVEEAEQMAMAWAGPGLPLAPPSPPPSSSTWPPPSALLMGMVVRRTDPRTIAQLVCHALIVKHRQGLVVRDNVVRIL
jgi:hypothetical protein